MNVVELKGIRREFTRGFEVLRGVDLAAGAGEVIGLLGPNGAGKTTLLRIAVGILHATGGSVRLFGQDPWEDPVAVKRRLGYVSESDTLPKGSRVRQILDLHAALFTKWDPALARKLWRDLSLPLEARVHELSKGQKRSLALLCAVAHRPELLILDEPGGGLDPSVRRRFLETSIHLLNEAGTTILFSSHHTGDVERIAGRVVLLHEGRSFLDVATDDIKERYCVAILERGTALGLDELLSIDGCLRARDRDHAVHALFAATPAEVAARLAGHDPRVVPVTLEDFFIEVVEGRG